MAEGKITIIRTKHNKQSAYFCMATEAVQDETLSWEARGVLAYLLSKPPDWKVMVADLKQKCGKERVYRILKELENAHYLRKEQVRRPDGTYEPVEYRVFESPSLYEPLPEKPETAKPEAVEPVTDLPETVQPETAKPEALLSIESLPSIESDKVLSEAQSAAPAPVPIEVGQILSLFKDNPPPAEEVKAALFVYSFESVKAAVYKAVNNPRVHKPWAYAQSIFKDENDHGGTAKTPPSSAPPPNGKPLEPPPLPASPHGLTPAALGLAPTDDNGKPWREDALKFIYHQRQRQEQREPRQLPPEAKMRADRVRAHVEANPLPSAKKKASGQ